MDVYGRLLRKRVNRRALSLGMLGAAGLRLFKQPSGVGAHRQAVPTPVLTGACDLEPGVQLLIDWRQGKPVVNMADLIPPLDWPLYSHPSMALLFRIPPNWTALTGWAESFTPAGMPIWTDRQPQIPQLSLARIVSPEEDAAFEFAVGNILGQPLTPGQAALVAKQGLLGENPDLDPICSYEDAYSPSAPTWFHADYFDRSVLVSDGVAIGHPSAFMPATTVTYQSLFGPKREYEELMRTVFLPILFQFLGGGADDGESGDGEDDGDPDDEDIGDDDDGGDDGDGDNDDDA